MEGDVVTKLKAECGQSYIKKIEFMFADISMEPEVDHKELIETVKPSFEVDIKILSQKVWPFKSDSLVKVPSQIQDLQDMYLEMYKEKHAKRKITWNYSQSTCILTANSYGKQFDIETSQVAGLILLSFNQNSIIKKSEFPELYDQALKTLCHRKHALLNESVEGGSVLSPESGETVFRLNSEFTTPLSISKHPQISTSNT